jgi:MFS family permease
MQAADAGGSPERRPIEAAVTLRSPMILVILCSLTVHSCYIGSKVVVSLYALKFGATPFTVGVLASFYAVVPLMLAVYTGRLADKSGMRLPLGVGAVFTAAAMLTGFLWRELHGLFVVAILVGTGFVFFNVSIQNLAGGIGRPEQRTRNFAWLAIGYSLSNLIGPLFAGLSIDHAGHSLTFLFFAFFPLFPLIVLAARPEFARGAATVTEEKRGNPLELLQDTTLRRLIVISGLSVASSELFAFYVPVFAHQIGLTATMTGVILGAYAIAILMMRFVLGRLLKALTAQQIMFGFMLLAALAFAIFPLLRSPYALMAVAFAIGVGVGATQPLLMSISYEMSPPGRTGEVTGLRLTANNIARIFMPVVAGAMGAAAGAAPVFWMNSMNLAAISWLAKRR